MSKRKIISTFNQHWKYKGVYIRNFAEGFLIGMYWSFCLRLIVEHDLNFLYGCLVVIVFYMIFVISLKILNFTERYFKGDF